MPARKTPQRLKMVRGDAPKRRQGPPVELDTPAPPDWLSETARAEWDRIIAATAKRPTWLHSVDRAALAAYVVAWSQFEAAARDVEERGALVPGRSSADRARGAAKVKNPALAIARDAQTAMRYWCRELGFSPDARGRVDVGRVDEPAPAARFLS